MQRAAVPAGSLRLRDAGGQVGAGDGGGAEATEPRQERGRGTDSCPQGQQPPQVPQAGRISLPGMYMIVECLGANFHVLSNQCLFQPSGSFLPMDSLVHIIMYNDFLTFYVSL